jgi:endonuclease YncB( thermonuclease family)
VRARRTFGPRGIFANPIGLALFVGLLAYWAIQSAVAPAPSSSGTALAGGATSFSGQVTRIVDGDTFWISSKDVRIRVWGLDAPERDTPQGPAATAALSRLISGQTLDCHQRDIDRYGRIVGQCFLADGRDITSAMIASGTAKEFCRFSRNHYRTC